MHHWTLGIFSLGSDGAVKATIVDSAPAEASRTIIKRLLRRVRVDNPVFICVGRQPYGSNECGVHVVVNAWRAFFNIPHVPSEEQLSLGHLRRPLAELARRFCVNTAREIALAPARERPPPYAQLASSAPSAAEHPTEAQQRQPAPIPAALVQQLQQQQRALQQGLRQHNPYVPGGLAAPAAPATTAPTATPPASPVGGAPRTDEELASSVNQCYLFTALKMLHCLDAAAFPPVVGNDARRAIQAELGQAFGRQHDLVETISALVRRRNTRVEVHYSADTLPRGAAPFVVLAAVRGVNARVPAGFAVECVGGFRGGVVDYGDGLAAAEGGHYVYGLSAQRLKRGNFRLAAYGLRRLGPPLPQLDGAQRIFMDRNDVHDDPAEAAALPRAPAPAALPREPAPAAPPEQQPPAPEQEPASEAEPAPPPPAEALSKKQVQQFARTLKVGEHVIAHWSRNGYAGIWAGVVESAYASQLTPEVHWTAERCTTCDEWRAMDDEWHLSLPYAGTTYTSLTRGDAAVTCRCPSIEDEDPIDAMLGDGPGPVLDQQGNERLERLRGELDGEQPARAEKKHVHEDERALAPAIGQVRPTVANGSIGHHWFVHVGCPPSIPKVAWRLVTEGTRKLHATWISRIKHMPADLRAAPLGAALVQLVLRYAAARNWAWSTIASGYSAIASALAALPMYTNETAGIDIRKDPVFSAASRRAMHNARTSDATRISEALPVGTYEQLTGYKRGGAVPMVPVAEARLLLQLMWLCAGRPGDVRQLRRKDVTWQQNVGAGVLVALKFCFGKGAAFWGPYTVHAVLPADVAKDLRAHMERLGQNAALFTERHQSQLSAAMRAAHYGLRSVRRGAIMFYAERGITDEQLKLLSGHKRQDTLLRYLGWGARSSTSTKAAVERAAIAEQREDSRQQQQQQRQQRRRERDPIAGAAPGPPADVIDAPKMGLYSGRNGFQGRRVLKPPPLFLMAAPSRHELGTAGQDDPATWRLHTKNVGTVWWPAIHRMAREANLVEQAVRAEQWCTTTQFFRPLAQPTTEADIPYARFTVEQVETLLDFNKLVPFDGALRGFVKAFPLPQPSKQVQRPIFDPDSNNRLVRSAMLELDYPSRFERRAHARNARFEAQFDFSAYFDQFELAENVRPYYVMRSRQPVRGCTLFALTRMPMGGCPSPGVAQTVTWVIVEVVHRRFPSVTIDTMIDNVRILDGGNQRDFVGAVRCFLELCAEARLTLNDSAQWAGLRSDDDLLRHCSVARGPRVFLGEEYLPDGTIRNSPGNVEKLRTASELFERKVAGEGVLTYRQFAALIGLALFMAHTVNVRICDYFRLMRAYSAIIQGLTRWDDAVEYIAPEPLAELRSLLGVLCANPAVELPALRPPSFADNDYDAVIVVDASGAGWGAYVRFAASGSIAMLQQRWSGHIAHSAHAEPSAALNAVRWTLEQLRTRTPRIALVTDHVALAAGQRRWSSAFCGFGRSFPINEFYRVLYAAAPDSQIFFVDGISNIADAPSRNLPAHFGFSANAADIVFPRLAGFSHPYATIARKAWQR